MFNEDRPQKRKLRSDLYVNIWALNYQPPLYFVLKFEMPINLEDLETAIRDAVPVVHLEIEDQSSGCGENYAITLVSEVRS